MAPLTILLVDDDPVTLEVLQRAIGKATTGWTFHTVGSCQEAVHETKKTPYDCILLDHLLPGVQGLECVTELRNSGYKLAIVLLTGYASSDLAGQAMRNGADDFLDKNQDISALSGMIRSAVSKRQELLAIEQRATEQHATLEKVSDKAQEILDTIKKGQEL